MLDNFNQLLKAIGMGSIEEMVNEILDDPDNYTTYVNGITFKGKNRTFKRKTSRKIVLHKIKRLDEFKISMNRMKRLMNYGIR